MEHTRKYRGKRQDDGEWLFGNLTVWSDGTASIDKEPTEGSPLYAVIEGTVGQGSTVIDKNGIEMYEGDIICGVAHWLEKFKPAVVTFRNGSFGLLWHRGDIEEFNPFTSLCNVEYEVVGNIYDNPELMEEK